MLQAEVAHGNALVVRMENHINTLSRMLLPAEYLATALTPEKPMFQDSSNPDFDSDKEFDPEELGFDYQAEYMAEVEEKRKSLVESVMNN